MADSTALITVSATKTNPSNAWKDQAASAVNPHAKVNDNSDTTYLVCATAGKQLELWFPAWAVPAGALIKNLRHRIRTQGGNTGWGYKKFRLNRYGQSSAATPWFQIGRNATTVVDSWSPYAPVNPQTGKAWTATDLGGVLVLEAEHVSGFDVKFVEVDLEISYNQAPVVDVTGPATPVIDTTRPHIIWDYTDAEGDAQERYRIKVFRQADAIVGGFDPETSALAVWDSGEVFDGAADVTVPIDLTNGVTYRVFVKASDVGSNGRYSAWDSWDFLMQLSTAAAPGTPVSTWQQGNNRFQVQVQGKVNLLAQNQADAEVDATGWENRSNFANPTRDAAVAKAGVASFKAVANAGVTFGSIRANPVVPAVVGKQYFLMGSVRCDQANRKCRMYVEWLDAGGAVISDTFASQAETQLVNANQFYDLTHVTAAAPAGTVNMRPVFYWTLLTGNENTWYDQIAAYPGTAAAAWSRGGLKDVSRLSVERSLDGGITFTALRTASDVVAANASDRLYTFYDPEVPHGVNPQYRAKTISTIGGNDVASPWSVVANSSAAATVTSTWIKAVNNPALNYAFQQQGRWRAASRAKRGAVHHPYGRTDAVAVFGGGDKMESWKQAFTMLGDADWTAFRALIDLDDTLIFQTPATLKYVAVVDAWDYENEEFFDATVEVSAHTAEVTFNEVGMPAP